MSRSRTAQCRACCEPAGGGMSQLMGADTRRVDLIAEGLQRYSQDVQNLRTMAQRAVFEMRNAWAGGAFERIAQRWEREAGPRLADAASSLSAMVAVLWLQAAEQRQVSGDAGSDGAQVSTSGTHTGAVGTRGHPGSVGGAVSLGVDQAEIDDLGSDASLVSMVGGNDNLTYGLALGRAGARAGSSFDVDTRAYVGADVGPTPRARSVRAEQEAIWAREPSSVPTRGSTLTQRLLVPRPRPVPRSHMGSALAPSWVHGCPRPRSGSPWTSAQRSASVSA